MSVRAWAPLGWIMAGLASCTHRASMVPMSRSFSAVTSAEAVTRIPSPSCGASLALSTANPNSDTANPTTFTKERERHVVAYAQWTTVGPQGVAFGDRLPGTVWS